MTFSVLNSGQWWNQDSLQEFWPYGPQSLPLPPQYLRTQPRFILKTHATLFITWFKGLGQKIFIPHWIGSENLCYFICPFEIYNTEYFPNYNRQVFFVCLLAFLRLQILKGRFFFSLYFVLNLNSNYETNDNYQFLPVA